MEKRARYKSAGLPYALVAPQLLVSVLFFFWPAVQALYQSVLLQDAFGSSVQF
ncbi:MAG: glycerol-3-phosphate transporter permease, partial [Burkholderia sp.]|nr:glycerol-3-phosphate transporter permease [Burkholderia sp.]